MFKPFVLAPPSLRRTPQPRDAVSVAKPMPKPNGYSWHALHIPNSQVRMYTLPQVGREGKGG